MNSQIIQTPIKFSIKTSNLDDIHKKIDKPSSKISFHKNNSKLSNSIDNHNLKNDNKIRSSKCLTDVSIINGIPVIKKVSMPSESSKKYVKLKRPLEEHQNDMSSKLRKCDDTEDTIIIEPESSSKLVIHPLKVIKTSEITYSHKEVETVNMSAIFKALEEKMNNIDKICKSNSQNPKPETDEIKPVLNNNKSESQSVKMILNAKKPIAGSTGIFKDENEVEDKNHEDTRQSRLESRQSNLKSLQKSILNEQKKSKDTTKEKLNSSHRDSREKEKKYRDCKNYNRSNNRESYKHRDKRDSHRDDYKPFDNYRNRRKSIEKSVKQKKINTESKLVYTTLGEAVKSHKSSQVSSDKLNLIIKDEYHDIVIPNSTIDLSEKVLEDSFKLHLDKQRSVKDKSKITENLKKLLDRKNSKDIKKEIPETSSRNTSAKDSSETHIISHQSIKDDLPFSNLPPPDTNGSDQYPISSFHTFNLEPITTAENISFNALPQTPQSDSSSHSERKFSNSNTPISEVLPSAGIQFTTEGNSPPESLKPQFFIKTANISFKISPKKVQTSNVFSQSLGGDLTSIPRQDTPNQPISIVPITSEPTFKVPFNIDRKSKISSSDNDFSNEEELPTENIQPISSVNLENNSNALPDSDLIEPIDLPDPFQSVADISDPANENQLKLIQIPETSNGIIKEPQILSNQSVPETVDFHPVKPQYIDNLSPNSQQNPNPQQNIQSDGNILKNLGNCLSKKKNNSKYRKRSRSNSSEINHSKRRHSRSKSRNRSNDHSRTRGKSKNKSKSQKRSKHRSRSRKFSSDHSLSRRHSKSTNQSKSYRDSRWNSKDRFESQRKYRYDSRSKEKSKSKNRWRNNNSRSSKNSRKDRFSSENCRVQKSGVRKKSKTSSRDKSESGRNRYRHRNSSSHKARSKDKSHKDKRVKEIVEIKKEMKTNSNRCVNQSLAGELLEPLIDGVLCIRKLSTEIIPSPVMESKIQKSSTIDLKKSSTIDQNIPLTINPKIIDNKSIIIDEKIPSNQSSIIDSKDLKICKGSSIIDPEISDKKSIIIDQNLLPKHSSIIDSKMSSNQSLTVDLKELLIINPKICKESSIIDPKIIDKKSIIIDQKIPTDQSSIINSKIPDQKSLIIDQKTQSSQPSIIDSKTSINDRKIPDNKLSIIVPNLTSEISTSTDKIKIRKEVLIYDQESTALNQTLTTKESVKSNDLASYSNSIPIIVSKVPNDPRCKKEAKISEDNLQDFLNRFLHNNCNPIERNTINIQLPPPPPPPMPSIQIPPSYNSPCDQNIYLNQFPNYNFNYQNQLLNLNQYNPINNTTVPQNMYHNNNNFPLSNVFSPVMNTYEQPSFNNQWYFPNESETTEACNNYPINEQYNSINPILSQPQSESIDSKCNDESTFNYNNHIHCEYNNINHRASNQPSNSDFHETLRLNSTNRKSSTSSLLNEVMDMDLASDSCKSIDSHKGMDANDQLSDKDDLSSCGDFEYEAVIPLDPFEKFPLAPRPKYEHIIETEVHPSARGKPFEYAYLKSTVCNCVPPNPDEIKLGKTACGENCFNRRIKVECNRKCPVYELCTNRRFQEQIYAPFEPFYCTNGKGWGIRSTNRIYPGTFIIEYVGELIDFHEFLSRIRQKSTYNHHFIMSIQKYMYIDAGMKGNWSRFVNHSCDPNTIIERWVVNGKTRIGFFSKKIIEENEEITIDYQFQQYGKNEQKCYCNSFNCTGIMGKVNEKLQDQIKTSHIKIRKELIQKIINRSSLKDISHVSDMITVIKEECLDRDTFYGFLEVLLRTDSEVCIRTFIECGGLKVITSFLETVAWNDWPLKLLYLKCLDHFKLKKRTILSSGSTAIQVVDYWANNPRYSLKQCIGVTPTDKDIENNDNDEDIEDDDEDNIGENNNQEMSAEIVSCDRNNPLEFILDDSTDPLESVEVEIKDLANSIRQYLTDEKEKFYIPKLKIVHSDSLTDLNDSESKSKDSASRASSVQGDYVRSKKRKIRRRCTEVIRKLPKEEFRRLFSERHEKQVVEKVQTPTTEVSNISNINMDSPEVFAVVKKLLSNVIIDEISRLKGSDKFATMPVEFQNLDLDKILSDLNIGGQEEIIGLMNNNNEENKASSASSYSNSSSKSVDDYLKSDLNAIIKKPFGLPPNWHSRQAENGKLYYYNTVTKITQWEIPVYPWDAGEGDPMAYNFGNASDYQISRKDVLIMFEEYRKSYKLQRLEERRKTRLERSIQRKLNLSPGEKNKIEFSKQVFRAVKTVVKPYNTSSCKIGRIQHKQDLKFLCEKFADTIIGKEVKLVANLEDLEMNANVKSKIKTYIEKFMANQGRCYKRSSKSKFKSSKKFSLNANLLSNCATNTSKTAESNKPIISDGNYSPDFSP